MLHVLNDSETKIYILTQALREINEGLSSASNGGTGGTTPAQKAKALKREMRRFAAVAQEALKTI